MWGARAPAAARMPSTVAGVRGRLAGHRPQDASAIFGGSFASWGTFVRAKAGRTLRARRRPARARATAGPRPAGSRAAPEGLAHAAVAKEVHEALPDERVRLDLTVSLRTADAERLTALAITRGQNRDALVAEILESYLREHSPRAGHDTPEARRESADGERRSSG